MEELFNTGCTIRYGSHAINSKNEICSRTILLDQGENILQGSPKDKMPKEPKTHAPTTEEMPFFIPNFIPKSTINYQSATAKIKDIKIKTLEGKQANTLIPNNDDLQRIHKGICHLNQSFEIKPLLFGSKNSWESYEAL